MSSSGGNYGDIHRYEPARESTAAAVGIVLLTVIEVVFVGLFTYGLVSGWGFSPLGNMFLGGVLAARVGDRAVVRHSLLALALVLVGMSAGVHLESGLLVVVAVAGTGLGFSVPFGPLFGLAFSTLADDVGVTLVAMLAVGNAGALVYPWLVGELVGATDSYALGFAAMGISVLGIWLLWQHAVAPREL